MRLIITTIFIFISSTILAYHTTQAKDSLISILNTSASAQQKVQIYRNLADITSDPSDIKEYLWKMYQEASKLKDRKSMLDALNDIVLEEAKANQRDSVAKYIEYVKQVATSEEINYLLPFYRMRLFDSSCYTDQKDEVIKKELNDQNANTNKTNNIYKEIASSYIVGNSFYMNHQIKKSIPYLDKAMKLTESLPEEAKYIYQKFIIWRHALAYAQSNRNKEAVKMLQKLIKFEEDKFNADYKTQRPFYRIDLELLQCYSVICTQMPYLTLEEEQDCWNKIQEIGKNLTNDYDKYSYYLCVNNYYTINRTQKDYIKAIAANDSLIKFAHKLAPQNLPGLYSVHSALYEESKDYPNALKYLKISHQVQDSLTTEATNKQLNELQVKYDLNTLNNEKAMLEIKNKQMLLVSLSILLLILVSISTYFYFSWKKEKRMKMELKVLHGKAQESEKMKQEFINSICHEIRTPLNAIVGFSDLIMNDDIDIEMRQEFPGEIQKSTVLLTNLVNSMLEVANLDVSEEELPCQSTDLRSICVQKMEQLKRKDGIEYKLDITENSMFIMTNEQYLTQVIEHLLDNANKFTEKGLISLSYQKDEARNNIIIYVTDTGCGIPKDNHENVFERFYKLNTFIQGNGLGLYLCQLIVKRLSGDIKIDPEYKEGTRMIVTLPIK